LSHIIAEIARANRDRGSDDDHRRPITCALRFRTRGTLIPLSRKRGRHVPCVPPGSEFRVRRPYKVSELSLWYWNVEMLVFVWEFHKTSFAFYDNKTIHAYVYDPKH